MATRREKLDLRDLSLGCGNILRVLCSVRHRNKCQPRSISRFLHLFDQPQPAGNHGRHMLECISCDELSL